MRTGNLFACGDFLKDFLNRKTGCIRNRNFQAGSAENHGELCTAGDDCTGTEISMALTGNLQKSVFCCRCCRTTLRFMFDMPACPAAFFFTEEIAWIKFLDKRISV